MSSEPPHTQVTVDAGRLWAGGAATAIVAALIGMVGVMVAEDVLDVTLVRPFVLFGSDVSDAARFALAGAMAALAACGLMHVLALTTPNPRAFFGWIVALLTAVLAVACFSVDAPTDSQVATAVIYVVIGLAVGALISGVAARSVRVARRSAPPPYGPPPVQ